MKTVNEIKAEKQKAIDGLITSVGMFFAFSNEQFENSKTPLTEGDKYVSFGAGGYLPKSRVKEFLAGMEATEAIYKDAIKSNKQRRALIADELSNYECYYTGDISDALNALGEGYTREEVIQVYNIEKNKAA